MQSPVATHASYTRLFARLGARLGVPVEFVQRRTYREVNELLATGRLDAAFVCTGGWLEFRRSHPGAAEVLAVPTSGGVATYSALVIVGQGSEARSLEDLAGHSFAFTDELSLSGRLWAVAELRARGRDAGRFFSSTLLTQNHDRSIRAVAAGLVDGAAVHSLVYAALLKAEPALGSRVRVLARSPEFGSMPVVASTRLGPEARSQLRDALLALAGDAEAASALEVLGIGAFVPADATLYDAAERVVQAAR